MTTSLRDPRYRAVVARLVECRKDAALTQRDLAERLGQPQSFVARIETNERRLDLVQLLDWLRALDVDAAAFLIQVAEETPVIRKRRR